MKRLKSIVAEEVRKALSELSVDEPKGGPFGKVLFSPQRNRSKQ